MASKTEEEEYYKRLSAAVQNLPVNHIKKAQWVNMIIRRIEDAKDILVSEGAEKLQELHAKVKETLQTYDVVTENNKKRLILKRNGSEPCKYIIPLEETYPVVMKAHYATQHGGKLEISEQLLKSNEIVVDTCISIAIKVCNFCQFRAKPGKSKKIGGLVNFINMRQESPDTTLDYLMIYQHESSLFMHLRPINSSEITECVAYELSHIFTDTGPPDYIVVKAGFSNILDSVLNDRLALLFNKQIDLKIDNNQHIEEIVKNKLTQWLKREINGKWCLGCYIVQWELNNTISADGYTPFQKFMGSKTHENINNILHEEIMLDTVNIEDLKIETELF